MTKFNKNVWLCVQQQPLPPPVLEQLSKIPYSVTYCDTISWLMLKLTFLNLEEKHFLTQQCQIFKMTWFSLDQAVLF